MNFQIHWNHHEFGRNLRRPSWVGRNLLGGILALAAALALLGVPGEAQTFRGAINGTVTDPAGAVVPGAEVRATNLATGVTHNTATTSDGQFSFQDLPGGAYKVVVAASGFPPVNVDNVAVTAGAIYTLPVKLSLAQKSTMVEVAAAPLTVDSTTTAQTSTIPSDSLQDVPLNGRDFSQLVATAPGYSGYSANGFGSLNGTRGNQMNWQIDGTDNNDFWHNIPAVNQGGVADIAGVVMPIDAIDEFSTQTASNAEGGRNAGGTVNVVLKSGANVVHGSAYYFNRNEAYSASSPFLPTGTAAPALRNQNYGGSVGGPIFKNKTFFFFGFERQQFTIGLLGLATEPSAAWQQQALALMQAHGVAENPLSATLIGNLWPGFALTGPAAANNFFSPVPATGFSNNGTLKLDHDITEKHHLSFHGFIGQGNQILPPGASPALATASSQLPFYYEVAPIHVQNYSLILNSALSNRMTNQVLFGVNYFNQVFHDQNNSFNTRALGLFLGPQSTFSGAPSIRIAGFDPVGITPPEGRTDATGHLTDILSYNFGKHQLRVGGEVRQGRVDEFYFRNSLGQFVFDGTSGPWANDPNSANVNNNVKALADFLSGNVHSAAITVGNAERQVTVNSFDFFGQDAWQLSRKLNLNFGLRYEYIGPLHNGGNDLTNFLPSQGLVALGSANLNSLYPKDYNNLAPRFGFAYQPKENGSLVLRGGYGVFYDQINMNPFLDYRPPNGGADGFEDNPAGASPVSSFNKTANFVWQPNTFIFPGVIPCPTGNGCGAGNVFNIFSVSQNFRTPYYQNYNFNVEQGFGKAVLQVGYVGSQGRKLTDMVDLNQPTPANDPNGLTTQQRRPFFAQFPNFGSINQIQSGGSSNYNSLQSTLKMRSWHGLTSQFAYTWAHELDDVSQYRGVLPQNSFNLKGDYASGDFDVRHTFSSSLSYEIPGSSHGPKLLTHGWQLNSLLSFHTGQPFNITTSQDNSGTFEGNQQRPNLIGNPFAGVSHTFSNTGVAWINPAAFAQPTPGTFGNLRRNQIYGPGYGNMDLSVFKNIPVRERFKVQLRAEMFNIFNRINLATPSGSFGISSFGVSADTLGDSVGAPGIGPGEPFNMQLAAKVIF